MIGSATNQPPPNLRLPKGFPKSQLIDITKDIFTILLIRNPKGFKRFVPQSQRPNAYLL